MFLCTYVDMFPQTNVLSDIKMNVSSHVETVCLLNKRTPGAALNTGIDMKDYRRISENEEQE